MVPGGGTRTLFKYKNKNRKMEILKMSSKGQIVIPQQMRVDLKIDEGSMIAIEKVNDMVMLKKVDLDLVGQFKKSLEDLKAGKVRRVA